MYTGLLFLALLCLLPLRSVLSNGHSPTPKAPGVWLAKPVGAGAAELWVQPWSISGSGCHRIPAAAVPGRLLAHGHPPALARAQRVPRVTDKPGSPCPARTCCPGKGGWLPGRALPTGEDFSFTKWKYSSTEFMEKRFKK